MSSAINYEKRNRITYVTINRPEAMNALGIDHSHEMTQIWTDFRDDPEVWVAILTGSGEKAFCSGADLKTYTPSLAQRNTYDVRMVNRLRNPITYPRCVSPLLPPFTGT